jgi:hypothetical protein
LSKLFGPFDGRSALNYSAEHDGRSALNYSAEHDGRKEHDSGSGYSG